MSLFSRKSHDREAIYAAAERAAAEVHVEAKALSAEVKEVVRQRRAQPPEDRQKRVWKRLNLYAASLDLVRATADCRTVEPVGMVAVPVQLVRNLQRAVEDYHPSDSSDKEQRVRTYPYNKDGWQQPHEA